jgi:hypothetical protein
MAVVPWQALNVALGWVVKVPGVLIESTDTAEVVLTGVHVPFISTR